MFTGIVEAIGAVESQAEGSLTISRPGSFHDLQIGSSVSIAGVCLSIVSLNDKQMTFNVVPETLSKTKLGKLSVGAKVNLERALSAQGRFDGHIVQGHVEGVGTVEEIKEQTDDSKEMRLTVPTALLQYIVPKGSLCLDGVSLTVAAVDTKGITIALIPHTLEHTTLGTLKKGDVVNIETDVLIRSLVFHTPKS